MVTCDCMTPQKLTFCYKNNKIEVPVMYYNVVSYLLVKYPNDVTGKYIVSSKFTVANNDKKLVYSTGDLNISKAVAEFLNEKELKLYIKTSLYFIFDKKHFENVSDYKLRNFYNEDYDFYLMEDFLLKEKFGIDLVVTSTSSKFTKTVPIVKPIVL